MQLGMFWKKSLMARLVGYFLLLSLLIVGLMGYTAYVQAEGALKRSIFDRLEAAATLKEDSLNHWIDVQLQNIILIAWLPEVQARVDALLGCPGPVPGCRQAYTDLSNFLDTMVSRTAYSEEIFIIDMKGTIVLSTIKPHERQSVAYAPYFIQGRSKSFAQSTYSSPYTRRPTITVVTPMFNQYGMRIAVLASHLSLAPIDRVILERTGLGMSGETYLVDRSHMVVSEIQPQNPMSSRKGIHSEGIDAALRGRDGAGLYSNYAGIPVVGVYHWIDGRGLALIAEMSQDEAFAPARRLAWIILAMGMALSGVTAIGIYLLARQIARPVLQIAETAIRAAGGDLTLSAPVTTEDEVGMMARAFNQMTAQLRQTMDNLEQRVLERTGQLEQANKELEAFSYSVSHDLRAPLRSVDGFSKALLDDYTEKLDDQGKDYLRRVRAASQRMGYLIDDMLTLSRVTRSEIHPLGIDMSEMASAIAAELRAGQPERIAEFVISSGLTARADPNLMRIVLSNLLGNAWKFTGRHASARIEVGKTGCDNGKAAFFVRDDGAGFDMSYASKLFGAFQRLHAVTEFDGTGVGLATVQRIIHRHGGQIWAEGAVEKGAVFYFTLPQ